MWWKKCAEEPGESAGTPSGLSPCPCNFFRVSPPLLPARRPRALTARTSGPCPTARRGGAPPRTAGPASTRIRPRTPAPARSCPTWIGSSPATRASSGRTRAGSWLPVSLRPPGAAAYTHRWMRRRETAKLLFIMQFLSQPSSIPPGAAAACTHLQRRRESRAVGPARGVLEEVAQPLAPELRGLRALSATPLHLVDLALLHLHEVVPLAGAPGLGARRPRCGRGQLRLLLPHGHRNALRDVPLPEAIVRAGGVGPRDHRVVRGCPPLRPLLQALEAEVVDQGQVLPPPLEPPERVLHEERELVQLPVPGVHVLEVRRVVPPPDPVALVVDDRRAGRLVRRQPHLLGGEPALAVDVHVGLVARHLRQEHLELLVLLADGEHDPPRLGGPARVRDAQISHAIPGFCALPLVHRALPLPALPRPLPRLRPAAPPRPHPPPRRRRRRRPGPPAPAARAAARRSRSASRCVQAPPLHRPLWPAPHVRAPPPAPPLGPHSSSLALLNRRSGAPGPPPPPGGGPPPHRRRGDDDATTSLQPPIAD